MYYAFFCDLVHDQLLQGLHRHFFKSYLIKYNLSVFLISLYILMEYRLVYMFMTEDILGR